MESNKQGFRITWGRGFQMTFPNGITISVQFGAGNYCENRDFSARSTMAEAATGEAGCLNAEIALWDASGTWITREYQRDALKLNPHDDVMGWLTTLDVAHAINWAATVDLATMVRWVKPVEEE